MKEDIQNEEKNKAQKGSDRESDKDKRSHEKILYNMRHDLSLISLPVFQHACFSLLLLTFYFSSRFFPCEDLARSSRLSACRPSSLLADKRFQHFKNVPKVI